MGQDDNTNPQGDQPTILSQDGAQGGFDGFDSADEMAQFQSMREESPAATDQGQPSENLAQQPDAAAADGAQQQQTQQQQQPGQDGQNDDGDDDGDDDPSHSQAGHPRRVLRSKHMRIVAEKDTKISKLQADLEAERIKLARAAERIEIINQAFTAPQGQPEAAQGQQPGQQPQQGQQAGDDPEPDEDNVFEHQAWLKRELRRTQQQMTDFMNGHQQERQQQTQAQTENDFYRQDVQAYATQQPHFIHAYNHVMRLRDQQLSMFHPDPEKRAQIIRNEEKGIVQHAMRMSQQTGQRVSAADLIYKLAESMGFNPATIQQPDQGGQQQQQPAQPGGQQPAANGQQGQAQQPTGQRPAGQQQKQPPSIVDEVERMRQNVDRNRSLSDGGGAPPPQLTIENLVTMNDEEFGDLWDRFSKHQQRQIAGG